MASRKCGITIERRLNNPWVNPYSHLKWLNDTIDDRGHTGDCFS